MIIILLLSIRTERRRADGDDEVALLNESMVGGMVLPAASRQIIIDCSMNELMRPRECVHVAIREAYSDDG